MLKIATGLAAAAGTRQPEWAEMVEFAREAERLDRSKSWLLSRAWVMARGRMADAVAQAS